MVLAEQTEHQEVVRNDAARLVRDPREDLAYFRALGERVEERTQDFAGAGLDGHGRGSNASK